MTLPNPSHGILLVNKTAGKTSFSIVAVLRKHLKIKKIGHAGTLDPFATGVMVMLIGRDYTTLSNHFLCQDKEYTAQVHLGISTTTYDLEGDITKQSDLIPSKEAITDALCSFQGTVEQIPPMFSAKKQNGKKLYELARKGEIVERKPVPVTLKTTLLDYTYPHVTIQVQCSKGTYIRSIAHDLGMQLGCGAHLTMLKRTRSGPFLLKDCFDGALLTSPDLDLEALRKRIQPLSLEIKEKVKCA